MKNEENFMLTYGDGLSNVNINQLFRFHNKEKPIITVTAVNPPVRYGELKIKKKKKKNLKKKYKKKKN